MKKFLITIIVISITVCASVGGLGKYMLDVAIHPESQRRFEIDSCYATIYKRFPDMKPWRDSLIELGCWRDTFLFDNDSLKHHAVIFEHNEPTAGSTIVLHGYDDNAPRMLRYAYLHYEILGRNVIVPEHFNHGESDGDEIRFGWLDRLDVTNLWIPLAHNLWPDEKMVIHGLSMGGALTMFTSGEQIPDSMNLIGFIEDCGFNSIKSQLSFQLDDQFGLPSWPIVDVASMICNWEYGWSFEDGEVQKQLAKCKLPMLFIHGLSDSYVPTSMVYENFAAKSQGYRELWLVPGADHAESINEAWDDYCKHCYDYIEMISKL